MRRVTLVVLLVAAALAAPAPAQAHAGSCTAIAPAQSQCTTGIHAAGGGFFLHRLEPEPEFTGFLESLIEWGEGGRLIRCEYVPTMPPRCESIGLFPPPGRQFEHICFSYTTLTEARGGIGRWGCSIQHD